MSKFEVYPPAQKMMDDLDEVGREKLGSNWRAVVGLRVVKPPLTIDQEGNVIEPKTMNFRF